MDKFRKVHKQFETLECTNQTLGQIVDDSTAHM